MLPPERCRSQWKAADGSLAADKDVTDTDESLADAHESASTSELQAAAGAGSKAEEGGGTQLGSEAASGRDLVVSPVKFAAGHGHGG